MKTFQIGSHLSISGDTLQEAIENDFSRIADHLHLGNAAGYQLDSVWYEYDKSAHGVMLHITAHGSDMLVNYDPDKDPPKEHSIFIKADPEECPERVNIELVDSSVPFDPFDDVCISTPDAAMGTMLGLINEVGAHHCKIHREGDVTTQVTLHFPTLCTTQPLKYAEYCRAELARRRPKDDKETARLMERIATLAAETVSHPTARFISETLFRSRVSTYFQSRNKVTALSKIRREKGITQQQLADASQVSVRQLQNYEKCPGSTLFSASKYVPQRLADALGVSVSSIIDSQGFPILVDQ